MLHNEITKTSSYSRIEITAPPLSTPQEELGEEVEPLETPEIEQERNEQKDARPPRIIPVEDLEEPDEAEEETPTAELPAGQVPWETPGLEQARIDYPPTPRNQAYHSIHTYGI